MRRRTLILFVITMVLAAILVGEIAWQSPSFQRYRDERDHAEALRMYPKPYAGCAHNLMWMDDAKRQWALENRKTTNDPPPTLNDLRA
jgi:hypothetical protein